MATHSSILAWKILWIEEPGWPQSTGLHRVGTWLSDWKCKWGMSHFVLRKVKPNIFSNKGFVNMYLIINCKFCIFWIEHHVKFYDLKIMLIWGIHWYTQNIIATELILWTGLFCKEANSWCDKKIFLLHSLSWFLNFRVQNWCCIKMWFLRMGFYKWIDFNIALPRIFS